MSVADLTPGEALVLLDPGTRHGKEAVKASLMWLLAMKYLTGRRHEQRGLFRKQETYLLSAGRASGNLSDDLKAVLRLATRARDVNEFINFAHARYGPTLDGFSKDIIIPSLVRRGLIEARRDTVFFIFPRTRYVRTPAGEALRQKIETVMVKARDLPRLLGSSPAQAAAAVASLGALVLIMPELRPHFSALAGVMQTASPNVEGIDPSVGPAAASIDQAANREHFELAFCFEAGMAALDSGFDAASSGGEGGGDGGGD